MSYNIDSTTILKLDARMLASDLVRLHEEHEDALPESSFIEYHLGPAKNALNAGKVCSACRTVNAADHDHCKKCGRRLAQAKAPTIQLANLWWSGEGSGNAYHELFPAVAALIQGTVEAIFVWEGGDSHSGVRIVDSVFTEHEVALTLGAEKK